MYGANPGVLSAPGLKDERVEELVLYFHFRLVQKRFRPTKRARGGAAAPHPEVFPDVRPCLNAFRRIAAQLVAGIDAGPLDALEYAVICNAFSNRWITVCHWLSPRRFREYLTTSFGAAWVREDDVPDEYENPPVALKKYKQLSESYNDADRQPCFCTLCNTLVNSLAQYKLHAEGRAHRQNERRYILHHEGASPPGPIIVPTSGVGPGRDTEEAMKTIGEYAQVGAVVADMVTRHLEDATYPTNPENPRDASAVRSRSSLFVHGLLLEIGEREKLRGAGVVAPPPEVRQVAERLGANHDQTFAKVLQGIADIRGTIARVRDLFAEQRRRDDEYRETQPKAPPVHIPDRGSYFNFVVYPNHLADPDKMLKAAMAACKKPAAPIPLARAPIPLVKIPLPPPAPGPLGCV